MNAATAGPFSLSMWTSLYWDLSPEDVLRHIADQGWGCIDLSAEHLGELWRSRDGRRIDAWRSLADELSIVPYQCHLFMDLNLASADSHERTTMERLLVELLQFAGKLGVQHAVFHPGWQKKGEPGPPEVVARAMEESLKRVLPEAQEAGVKVAIENTMGPVFGADPADLARLAEAVDPGHVGICLDSSHANADKRGAREAVLACGGSLFCLHLSDNDGSGDQHRLPYEGTVDWVALLEALGEVGFAGPLNFELPALSARPLPVRDAAFSYLQQIMQFAATGADCCYRTREESMREYIRQGWHDPKFGYE
jgi:sugar phosphate isomerase/epimerase